ncbi:FAD binding domain-containing protein [Anoxybacter fermentans]|nr:FAD binding domain-containing protein [Anoxybacter fermentans]
MGLICFTPQNINEAIQYLHQYGDETTILAGGTDVLVRYYGRLDELGRIMNIYELDELKSIRIVDDEIEVGSLVTHTQLEESTIILNHAPLLAEAAAEVGSPQIRNRGTIGGNVANSSPAGDTLPPLIALDAKVKLLSLDRGERIIPVSEFFTGPGRNVAKEDELITGFVFPIPKENYRGSFVKLGYRKALAISTVNAAVMLALDGDVVEDCRIVLGAVAPTPVRVKLTEEILKGNPITDQILESAMNQLVQEISPISDLRGSSKYRLNMAKVLVVRAIHNIFKKGGRTQ